MNNQTLAFSGDLFLNEFLPDKTYAGLLQVPGMSKFEITIKTKEEVLKSNGNDSYGAITHSFSVLDDVSGSIELQEFDMRNYAMVFCGVGTLLNSGSGTVEDLPVTAMLGRMVSLGKRNITDGSVVVTNSGGTVTYVLGTDYDINYKIGYITAKSGGAITASQSLLVSFEHLAISGQRIHAGTQAFYTGRGEYHGINLATGEDSIITIPKWNLASDSKASMLSQSSGAKFEMATLKATFLKTNELPDQYGRYALFTIDTF
jgi:hypothetical protein